jgi:hypothetical protein
MVAWLEWVAHIDELCQKYKIRRKFLGLELVGQSGVRGADTIISQFDMEAPRPYNELAYFTNLHEVGHVVTIGTNFEYWERMAIERRIEAEAQAWLWALDNAKIKPSSATLDNIRWCLVESYMKNPIWQGNRDAPEVREALFLIGPPYLWA